jgi:hypothetical protein
MMKNFHDFFLELFELWKVPETEMGHVVFCLSE